MYPFASALVTGASSGIGEAMARRLAAAGVPTVVVARRRDRLEALATELPGIEVLPADLTTSAGVEAVAARLRDPDRPVELLVNNAGFGTSGPFVAVEAGRPEREVALNVSALTSLCHVALPGMVERRRGWVLNVSSVVGFQAVPYLAVYSATKAYVISFTEALHEELRGTGVHATVLCPGLTRTEFQQVSNTEGFEDRYPAFAWATADEVAATALADCAKGKAISLSGLTNVAAVVTSELTPRRIKRWVVGRASGRG
ncbi:MAG TPA: SDR family oxidoreductase [Acidimicrobiales bacterium]